MHITADWLREQIEELERVAEQLEQDFPDLAQRYRLDAARWRRELEKDAQA